MDNNLIKTKITYKKRKNNLPKSKLKIFLIIKIKILTLKINKSKTPIKTLKNKNIQKKFKSLS